MRIKPESIEKVKATVDIVEVINDFVALKKRGKDFWGLSPFANEKTPSFSVSQSKGFFKDFSSGKAGDAVTFMMEHEGMNYPQAIEYLAEKYGITLEYDGKTEKTPDEIQKDQDKESIIILLAFASQYYQELLHEHEDGKAIGLSYFKQRGFNEKTIKTFGLGYSLEAWDNFTKHALDKNYTIEILEKSGMTIVKNEKKFDRFRDRVMFPIHNLRGKTIAFGGRILKKDKKSPKYLNSPESLVYHKSRVLYGLFQAKKAIRDEDNCYLVEGYTDVLSLHQSGIQNVVSSSGTSLTEEQIRLIRRFSENITVLFDGDAAGIKASLRGVDLILTQGMNVKIALIPSGEDPDSYLNKLGTQAFLDFLEQEKSDFIIFKTKLYQKEAKNDPIKKANVIKEVVSSIIKIPDPIKRAVFYQETSQLLEIDEQTLIIEGNKLLIDESKKQLPAKDQKVFEGLIEETTVNPSHDSEKTDSVVSPIFTQEKETIKILLKYAGKKLEEELTVCSYLLEELEDIQFESGIYQQFLEIYRDAFKNGDILEADYFIHAQSNETLKKETINLISQKYEISEKWKELFNIYTTEEEEVLTKITYELVLRIKLYHTRKTIKAQEQELAKANNSQEEDGILYLIMQMKSIEMELAKSLNSVILK